MTQDYPHIILASGSPRRREILRAHGIDPDVIVADVDEEALIASWSNESLSPKDLVQRLARAKAWAVYEHITQEHGSRCRRAVYDTPAHSLKSLILAADTVVYKKGVGILGKPACHGEAVAMLEALREGAHHVITGVTLIDAQTGHGSSFVDETTVHFGAYSLEDIEEYLVTEPPFDKAGSYAIQGMWGAHVVALEGDLENVIGLPFYRLEEHLCGGYTVGCKTE